MSTASRREPVERFMRKVLVLPSGCWEWQGKRQKGYGMFWLQGRWTGAHRWSLENLGRVPVARLFACHSCDNPPCVNPDHLFAGAQSANMADMKRKGRRKGVFAVGGETHGMHKLTASEVVLIRERRTAGETIYRIAADYPVSPQQISRISRGERWVA